MSCNCNNAYYSLPCCCPTPVGTTTTTTLCPNGNPCDEMFSSDCIIYNGVAAPCFNVNTGDTVTEMLQAIITQLGACATLTVNVPSALTSAEIVSFGTPFYTLNTGNTLPCVAGVTVLGLLTSALTNGSLTTNVTTGATAAKLLIIKNNLVIGSANITANQTNTLVTISGLTWVTTDKLTIQLIAQ
jgi:hypothetical protein